MDHIQTDFTIWNNFCHHPYLHILLYMKSDTQNWVHIWMMFLISLQSFMFPFLWPWHWWPSRKCPQEEIYCQFQCKSTSTRHLPPNYYTLIRSWLDYEIFEICWSWNQIHYFVIIRLLDILTNCLAQGRYFSHSWLRKHTLSWVGLNLPPSCLASLDRKSVVLGKSVDLGCCRFI